MRCIFEFDVSAICYFVSTLFGVLTFAVLLEYDFEREGQPNPILLECIKEWNQKGFDVDIYAVEINIHNYSTVDREEHGIEFSIDLEKKTLFMEGEYNSFPYEVVHLLSKTLKALEVKDDR
jgi:hypothetical protein